MTKLSMRGSLGLPGTLNLSLAEGSSGGYYRSQDLSSIKLAQATGSIGVEITVPEPQALKNLESAAGPVVNTVVDVFDSVTSLNASVPSFKDPLYHRIFPIWTFGQNGVYSANGSSSPPQPTITSTSAEVNGTAVTQVNEGQSYQLVAQINNSSTLPPGDTFQWKVIGGPGIILGAGNSPLTAEVNLVGDSVGQDSFVAILKDSSGNVIAQQTVNPVTVVNVSPAGVMFDGVPAATTATGAPSVPQAGHFPAVESFPYQFQTFFSDPAFPNTDIGSSTESFENYVEHIDFGDGTAPVTEVVPQQFLFTTLSGAFPHSITHTYTAAGTYTASYWVEDNHDQADPNFSPQIWYVKVNVVPAAFDPSGDLLVGGTSGDDTVQVYGTGNGNVSVIVDGANAGPFDPTGIVVIDTGTGNDTTILGGGISMPVYVAGSEFSSNRLVVNATAGTDAINFQPTSRSAGNVSGAGPGLIAFGNVEQVDINGQGGNDTLTYTTPANGRAGAALTLTPGATADSGTVTGQEANGSTLPPLDYTNLGGNATLGFASTDGQTDTLNYNGTVASDVFNLDGANGGTVSVDKPFSAGGTPVTIAALMPGVAVLNLQGVAGNDEFNASAALGTLPYNALFVDGGPSSDPTVNLAGDGTPATVNLAATPPTVTGGGLGFVTLAGTDVLNLNAGAGAVTVNGTSGPDAFSVTPTGANTVTTQLAGLNLTVNTTTTGAFTVDPRAGNNSVTVNGTPASDTISVVRGANTGVTVSPPVGGPFQTVNVASADTQALVVNTGLGADTVNVSGTSGPTSLTVNGGGNPRSDTLNVTNTAAGTTTVTPGATPDAGTIAEPATDGSVAFTGMTSVSVTGAGAAAGNTIVGIVPNGDDTLFLQHLGATDRFWVNNQAPTSFSGFGTVTLRGLFGNDQFNVNPVGLAAAVTAINVNGASGGNSLVVNGSAAADAVTFAPTGPAAGSVSFAAPAGTPTTTFTAVQGVNINGQGGGDALTIQTPMGADTVTYTSGPAMDAGTAQVDSLVPLSFSNLGAGGGVALTDTGLMSVDTLQYNGTPGNDTFTVNVPTGVVSLGPDVPVTMTSVATLDIDGQGGSNAVIFNGSAAAQNFTLGRSLQGNGFSLSDSLKPVPAISGTNIGQVNVNSLGAGALGVNDLSGTGVSLVGLALSPADAVTLNSPPHDETVHITSSAGVATVTGLPALINLSGASAASGDSLLVNGGPGNDTIEATPDVSKLFAVTLVGGPGSDTLFAAGRLISGGGRATVDFSAATGPVTIDMDNHNFQMVYGGVSLQLVDTFAGFNGSPWNDIIYAHLLPQGRVIHGGGGADQLNVDTQGLRVYVTDAAMQAVEASGSITFDLPMRLNFTGAGTIADLSAAIRYTHTFDLAPAQLRRLLRFLRTHKQRLLDALRLENVTGLAALYGPLTLTISGLPPGVTVVNATGITTRVVPGVPYIRFDPVNNLLNPGQQLEQPLLLRFSQSALKHFRTLTYFVSLFAGFGPP